MSRLCTVVYARHVALFTTWAMVSQRKASVFLSLSFSLCLYISFSLQPYMCVCLCVDIHIIHTSICIIYVYTYIVYSIRVVVAVVDSKKRGGAFCAGVVVSKRTTGN